MAAERLSEPRLSEWAPQAWVERQRAVGYFSTPLVGKAGVDQDIGADLAGRSAKSASSAIARSYLIAAPSPSRHVAEQVVQAAPMGDGARLMPRWY